MIHTGDCVEVMAAMPENSVDAIVCDPPYNLEFMGKTWDRNHQHEPWARAALRVAKPGAYLLAFGGTRTYHRLAVAIEDSGWIIRDCLVWAYASGFPKSKALLKPAWEPIVMARKPGPLRELAIDACRIPTDDAYSYPNGPQCNHFGVGQTPDGVRSAPVESSPLGRWPANVVLTDPIFDGDTEGVVGGGEANGAGASLRTLTDNAQRGSEFHMGESQREIGGDTGTYSRFFLIPKAARSEREPVFGGLGTTVVSVSGGDEDDLTPGKKSTIPRRNHHPTVKPVDLMRHLVRLVTPQGGTVLDPFLGSGTTAIAAEMEGFDWIGVEREPEYVAIAEARLMGVQKGLGLDVPAPTPTYSPPPDSKMPPIRHKGPKGWNGGWASDQDDAA